MAHTLRFFTNRIGKRVFRDANSCDCKGCADVIKNGLIIHSKEHAQYLKLTEEEYEEEGIKLNYRDKK